MAKVCTCPSRKLANALPVFATPGQIAADGGEGKRSRRPWRLDHVEPLPSPVEPHLHGVAALQPGQRIGDLRDAGAEVRGRVARRSELLVAVRREGRHRVGKLRIRRDAGNVERGSRSRRQRHRAPLDGCAAYLRCALRSARWPRRCADSSTQTPTPSCPADRRPRCRPGWCRCRPERPSPVSA